MHLSPDCAWWELCTCDWNSVTNNAQLPSDPLQKRVLDPLDLVRPEGIILPPIYGFPYTLILSLAYICSKSRFSLIYEPTKHILTDLCIGD